VDELRDQYGVGRRIARQWLQNNRLLPLLDGLDEVAAPQRGGCVQAINAFLHEQSSEGIVVCARIADYQAIGAKLALDAAVLAQPLDDAQLDRYLAWAGTPLAGVPAVLAQDAELRELVCTPLLLHILALAYQDRRPEELQGLPVAAQRRGMFDAYVQRMFARWARNDPGHYSQEQTLRWLRWLAERLAQDQQTVFQIELMQPWWLRTWFQRGLYVLFTTIGATLGGAVLGGLFGLLLGLIYGLELTALGFGLGFGLLLSLLQRGPSRRHAWQAGVGGLFAAGLAYLPWAALDSGGADGIWVWGFGCVASGLATGALIRRGAIRPTETLRWS
jgi:hypothetical protein